MKPAFWTISLFLLLAGCASVQTPAAAPDPAANKTVQTDAAPVQESPEKETARAEPAKQEAAPPPLPKQDQTASDQKIEINRFSWRVPAEWEVEKGLDSFAFKLNGEAIGGLEGLGYAPSVENLLPNHAEVVKIEELKESPTKTYKATLKRTAPAAAQNSNAVSNEVHLYFFLGEKAVYDLFFDLKQVNEEKALQIAKSIKIK